MSIASRVRERFYSGIRDVHQHEDRLADKVLWVIEPNGYFDLTESAFKSDGEQRQHSRQPN
jgi:hypothetical protein